MDKLASAPGVDVDTVAATANAAAPWRPPEVAEPAGTVVDATVDGNAAQQAGTALPAPTSTVSPAEPIATQVISAAPEELTRPRPTVSGLVLGGLATAGLAPLATDSPPLAPVDSPMGWAVAAVARRQFGQAVTEQARSVAYSPTLTSQSADTTADAQPFAATAMTTAATMSAAANTAPVDPDPTVGAPDHTTGVVTGKVNATDPDGNALTYAVTGPPSGGTVTVNQQTGSFSYTPTQATRLAAGLTAGLDTDGFTVTVSDGQASTPMAVTVPISSTQTQLNQPITVGTTPSGVAASPNSSRVYVANSGNNTVYVINTATNQVISTIGVGSSPQGLAISPDGTKAYVANGGNNTVSVINTATNQVISTIGVGSSPQGLAISPDGTKAYVANGGSNTVSVINTATKPGTKPIDPIVVGTSPQGVAISRDGTRVYVANSGSGTVSVINTATNQVISTIGVGSSPSAVAVTPTGDRVYVANRSSNTVSVINTATNSVVNTITAGTQPSSVMVSPDGSLAYVANGPDTMSVIDINPVSANYNKVITTVAIDPNAETSGHVIALSPDGTRLYVSDAAAADRAVRVVSLVHVNTAPQVNGPPTVLSTNETDGSIIGSVNMKPDIDGDKLTFSTAPGSGLANGTVTYDAAAGTYTYTPTQAAREQAAQNPGLTDRFTVNVSDGQGGTTAVLVTVTISPKAAAPSTPGLSATTTPIGVGADAYAVAVNGNRAYVANFSDDTVSVIDTGTNRVVGTIPVGSGPTAVAVKPDGTRVYVANYNEATVSVIDTNAQSANYNKVIKTIAIPWGETGSVSGVNRLAVSPDGTKVYVSGIDNTVSVIDTATNTIGQPYDVAFETSDMAVSPDSSRLYIADYGGGSIHIRDAKTMQNMGNILLEGTVFPQDIVVSPNGKRLYALTAVYRVLQHPPHGVGDRYRSNEPHLQASHQDDTGCGQRRSRGAQRGWQPRLRHSWFGHDNGDRYQYRHRDRDRHRRQRRFDFRLRYRRRAERPALRHRFK